MKPQIVSFHCILKNKLGTVLGSTFNHDVINQAGMPGAPLSALAQGMQGLKKGEKRKIALSAGDAYGFYDLTKVITRPREEFATDAKFRLGEKVILRSESGEARHFRVTEIGTDVITLDANHPLAGQDLIFEIDTLEARDATPDELIESDEETPDDARVH